jgi:hypothetical protein
VAEGKWPAQGRMADSTVARVNREAEARGMSTASYIHQALNAYWASLEEERRRSERQDRTVQAWEPTTYPLSRDYFKLQTQRVGVD